MANGNGSVALGAAALAFIKGKMLSIVWMLVLSGVSIFGSYKLFAYRMDQNSADIKELKSTAAFKPEEDRKQQEVISLLNGIREDMRAETDVRQQNDALILQEIRRANERIDQLLRDAAQRRNQEARKQ